MYTHFDLTKAPVVTAEQRASDELIRLITKLRWMGLDEEAIRIERRLLSGSVGPCESVLAQPRETD
jgi:hypothetical protein